MMNRTYKVVKIEFLVPTKYVVQERIAVRYILTLKPNKDFHFFSVLLFQFHRGSMVFLKVWDQLLELIGLLGIQVLYPVSRHMFRNSNNLATLLICFLNHLFKRISGMQTKLTGMKTMKRKHKGRAL
eukprot:NODE_788_length_4230_cov_0.560881.p5 type:complete len:127 gc:universal NODE_788_length_4230_cov_0.560881:631-1011(+)